MTGRAIPTSVDLGSPRLYTDLGNAICGVWSLVPYNELQYDDQRRVREQIIAVLAVLERNGVRDA